MHGADEHPHVEGEAEKEVEEGHGCPVEGPVTCSFFKNLCDAFGWKLLLLVGLAEITLKGFLAGGGTGGLVGTPIEFLLKEYEVKAADLQVYKSAVSITWAIKPLFGLIADSMPILGFNRTSYFALNSICGVSALFLIGFFPSLSLPILLLMFFLVFMDIAWSDLLTEAVYSTHLREKPDQGPSLISFIWGGIGIGKLFCTSIVGILMEKVGNRAPYLIAALAAAFTLLITFLNLPEETSRRGRCCKKLGGSEMPLAIVGLVIGLGALSLALLSVFGGNLYTKAICAGILAVVALSLVSVTLTPIVAKVNAFFFIQNICSFSISGASFYFFTDGPEAYPDGPHLSKVQKAATKKARQAQGEAVIAARVAEAGYEGQARSEALKVAHDAHFARVMHEKTDRLAEDAATKRALREERAAAAAGRRCLSEARARFARHWLSPAIEAQDDGNLPSLLADDPVVRKARALCSGVAQAVSQLEEQNQLLKSKASLQLMNIPRSEPPRERKSPTPFQGPFDNEELIAKAKELLSDYKPEKQRLPSARSSARTTPTREPSSHGSPRQGDLSALQRARQQCTDVCIELSTKSRAMKR